MTSLGTWWGQGAKEAAACRKYHAGLCDSSMVQMPLSHSIKYFFKKTFPPPSKHGALILKLKQKRFWKALLCSACRAFGWRWTPPETSAQRPRGSLRAALTHQPLDEDKTPGSGCWCCPVHAALHVSICRCALLVLAIFLHPLQHHRPLGRGLQQGEQRASPRPAPQPPGVTLPISAAT